jgi:hypothetical protein
MSTELATGPIGAEAKYDVKLEEGKLHIAIVYDGVETDAELKVKIDAGLFIDKLAAAIPGQIDDAIFAVLKGALLK